MIEFINEYNLISSNGQITMIWILQMVENDSGSTLFPFTGEENERDFRDMLIT